jgi:hypothetical protein
MIVRASFTELAVSCAEAREDKDCACIDQLKSSGGIPTAIVGLQSYELLQAALKAGEVKGAVETRVSNGSCLLTAAVWYLRLFGS